MFKGKCRKLEKTDEIKYWLKKLELKLDKIKEFLKYILTFSGEKSN